MPTPCRFPQPLEYLRSCLWSVHVREQNVFPWRDEGLGLVLQLHQIYIGFLARDLLFVKFFQMNTILQLPRVDFQIIERWSVDCKDHITLCVRKVSEQKNTTDAFSRNVYINIETFTRVEEKRGEIFKKKTPECCIPESSKWTIFSHLFQR